MGRVSCVRCETPLIYRYLGAIGRNVAQLKPGESVGERYLVVAPQTWLDTRPHQPPELPDDLPEAALPYLQLYPYRLHLPLLHGFYQGKVMLLENIPVEANGKSQPTLASGLKTASPVRQVYWLWQMLELWNPLRQAGVSSSLLISGNLRVDGAWVRLRSLFADSENPTGRPALKDLATLWQSWREEFAPEVATALEPILAQLQATDESVESMNAIAQSLNRLLLQQAARLPLRLSVAGASSAGPQYEQNEDTCYPLIVQTEDPLSPQVAIICDGIGGHAGGEVASQLAVRSLQLQIRALLTEVGEQTEAQPPDLVAQQLEAMVRVVNNLIAAQNDAQGREARQRMGTTLLLAIQLPQRVSTPEGDRNAHELYLVHIGDSRAYWLTEQHCRLLTVDDDLAGREVRNGHAPLWDALQHPEAGALTQALGTREAELLYPTVQRFILEEDGVLLLCSDGVSDYDLVETGWRDLTRSLLAGERTPQATAQDWVKRADEQNGHDNASAVVMLCRVSAQEPQVHLPPPPTGEFSSPAEPELSEAAKALLYDEAPEPVASPARSGPLSRSGLVVALLLLLTFGAAVVLAVNYFNPGLLQRLWQRSPVPEEPGQG